MKLMLTDINEDDMAKLIKEAEADDRFNTQMKKVQDAVSKLDDLIGSMQGAGSMTKMTSTQKIQLKYVAEDFKRLWEKSQ
jgi:hypothetical protein